MLNIGLGINNLLLENQMKYKESFIINQINFNDCLDNPLFIIEKISKFWRFISFYPVHLRYSFPAFFESNNSYNYIYFYKQLWTPPFFPSYLKLGLF
jgi:hypothetical protein